MAKAFSERPRWQRYGIVGGWAFLALVVLAAVFGDPPPEADAAVAAAAPEPAFDTAVLRDALTGCDDAWSGLPPALEAGEPFGLYGAASDVIRLCDAGWKRLRDIERETDAPAGLIEVCQIKANERERAAEAIAAIADGDLRPSAMQEARQRLASAEVAALRCDVRIVPEAAEQAGLTP